MSDAVRAVPTVGKRTQPAESTCASVKSPRLAPAVGNSSKSEGGSQ